MQKQLTLKHASRSDVGLTRSDNQDSCGKFPEDSENLYSQLGQLFIVADGMGGHQGGREASQMAVRIIQEQYFSDPHGDIDENLEDAFQAANREIYALASSNTGLLGMGTTCTAMALVAGNATIAHVGDSRAYRINDAAIEQLTEDHSQVAEMERQGILTHSEARSHPHRYLLNRALGANEEVEIDIYDEFTLSPGDCFLLCSDGLANVENEELKKIVLSNTPEKACDELIKLANQRGGEDNVTVQIIKIC